MCTSLVALSCESANVIIQDFYTGQGLPVPSVIRPYPDKLVKVIGYSTLPWLDGHQVVGVHHLFKTDDVVPRRFNEFIGRLEVCRWHLSQGQPNTLVFL